MATVILSTVGAALGASLQSSFLGLTSVTIGRALGATAGKLIDESLMGLGSDPVEVGRVDRFRLSGASEGAAIYRAYGRVRLGGQIIWASDFAETATSSGGGKGGARSPATTRYSYSVSLAIAICEGEITSVGRVWADGAEIAINDLNMTVYSGQADQMPDPLIEAIEGTGQVPAYRGTAYVVFEDLPLDRFGNRVPQFSFEVTRPDLESPLAMPLGVEAVALVPGTGEYALSPEPVYYGDANGGRWAANLNSPSGLSDFETSMAQLDTELPNCRATSLVVCWFGDDLRCGSCQIKPKVETLEGEGVGAPWTVSGELRTTADTLAQVDARPIYGGTPSDQSVVQSIQAMRAAGHSVLFYPFILMDQLAGNGLPDPYENGDEQPALPWRGRITLSLAPGRDGSPDGTAQAEAEVNAFFGTAQAADFTVGDGVVSYTGDPEDWGMRRFILHYAALCAAAGGIDSFAIGTEMRGLTWLRGPENRFVAVEQFRTLVAEVRQLLPDAKLGYAADWSEYFGYQPQDGSGDRYFHLDPLWADDNIDYIGIDNYMPLSDWRDGPDHTDAAEWGSIYNLDYLKANIQGGEGYDWFYHSDAARAAQIRTPITDGQDNEPWVYRYKDLLNWWRNTHFDRIGGLRVASASPWEPRSKPIWFTELGCGAIDKGTNQPNKFLDPKSSESAAPRFSNGRRDDFIQAQYLRAMFEYWGDAANNPLSDLYPGRMVDMARAFVWAWDTRPFPFFPNNTELWTDGPNFLRGHWINGRASARPLASVVSEICARAGLSDVDVSDLTGVVRGYTLDRVSDARAELQPLMLAYSFDAVERDGTLVFRMRTGTGAVPLNPDTLALSQDTPEGLSLTRASEVDLAGRVRLRFIETEGDHVLQSEEAIVPDDRTHAVASSETALSLTRAEARQTVARWLGEARVARDTASFALPPSKLHLGAGDIVSMPDAEGGTERLYRIDRVEQGTEQAIEAVRIEPSVYEPGDVADDLARSTRFIPPVPVRPVFLDLPLLAGDEVPHAPYLALTAAPWPGTVAVYSSDLDQDFVQDQIIAGRSTIGRTLNALPAARPGLWDRGPALEVELVSGTLESRPRSAILNGANLAAVGDGTANGWELLQFQDVQIVGPKTFWLTTRLRGQLGTDALMPDVLPAGSTFVFLDGVPEQIPLRASQRRIARNYRIGPSLRPVSDPSYVQVAAAFDGNGLRPYAPVHLRAAATAAGDIALTWIRRTRIDGDSWDTPEVPLGEEREAYLVRVYRADALVRELEVVVPTWTYSPAQQAQDGSGGPYRFEVAQLSARFGPGPFAQLAWAA